MDEQQLAAIEAAACARALWARSPHQRLEEGRIVYDHPTAGEVWLQGLQAFVQEQRDGPTAAFQVAAAADIRALVAEVRRLQAHCHAQQCPDA
jgi:hypothetical protein